MIPQSSRQRIPITPGHYHVLVRSARLRSRGETFPIWRACLTLASCLPLLAGCDRDLTRAGKAILPVRTLGRVGLAPGEFNYPRAMDAGEGSLWIIDKSARVQRINPTTGDCEAWFTMPRFARGMPTGITLAPFLDGRPALYIADTHEHRVLVYDLPRGMGDAPELRAEIGSYGDGDGQFIYPTDVAVLADESGLAQRIYVSEYGGNDRVSVFDAGKTLRGEMGYLGSFGTPGSGDGAQFDRPQSITLDRAHHEIIVADASNHRLGRFTLDGELIAWIDGRAAVPAVSQSDARDETDGFNYPYGVLMLIDRRALVSEFGGSRVSLVDLASGEIRARYGHVGRGEGEIVTPWAIAGCDGLLYVLDSGNNRVMAFRPVGVSSGDLHCEGAR